jgi:chemotaxis protein MotB
MADEKKMIVIKKITIAGAGHHGGAWKVAFADFMTAMMAFFLVMWLLNQSEETKKAVSDYFSTPSVIEYNFQNFGVELTLEKLFLDLLNEPLKAFQEFLEPMDKTPNILDFGSQKVVAAFMADQLGDLAKQVKVNEDGLEFVILDTDLFDKATAKPSRQFANVMEKVKMITTGLADSDLIVTSKLFNQSVPGNQVELAQKVSSERVDIVKKKLEASLENASVTVKSDSQVQDKKDYVEGQPLPNGLIEIRIKQKPVKSDGTKAKKLEVLFGDSNQQMNVYDNFVKQVSAQKKKTEVKENSGEEPAKSEQ